MREKDESKNYRYSKDRLLKAQTSQGKAYLSSNGDLLFYIPDITLRDVDVSGVSFPRKTISPLFEDTTALRDKIIPSGGIHLRFGGSLEKVDIQKYFISED